MVKIGRDGQLFVRRCLRIAHEKRSALQRTQQCFLRSRINHNLYKNSVHHILPTLNWLHVNITINAEVELETISRQDNLQTSQSVNFLISSGHVQTQTNLRSARLTRLRDQTSNRHRRRE